jgi:hypothetical protein
VRSCSGCSWLLLLGAVPASAHQPTTVVVEEPRAGTAVRGDAVTIRLHGDGGTAAASFQILVDGRILDVDGRFSNSLFTTHRLGPGEHLTYRVALDAGAHEVRITHAADTDSSNSDQVVRFRLTGADTTGPALVAEALLVALGLGHGVLARRWRA